MSYELNKAKENPAFDVELLIWMGNTLRNAKRYHEALKYHSRALSVARTIKDKNILADCYRYTGTVYRGLKMNDSAVYYLKKGADFWIQEKWHDRMHVVGANLVNWLVKDNKLDDAKKYVLIIKDTSVYNYRKNDYQKLNVSEALYNYYNKLNDYKLANIYLRDFVAAKDSISSRRIQNNINEQNLKLEFQHQQENFRLEQKLRDIELNSELKEEQAFSKMMAGMVIGFVIIIGYGFGVCVNVKKRLT
ncbi:MAG: tetratricopeptide repeat protein [Bacteroidia bacterium]|nr:tetratricopeptide repeat protein [Bacteroidia bacterium]